MALESGTKIYQIGEISQRNKFLWILRLAYIGIPAALAGAFFYNVIATNPEFFGGE